MVKQKISPKLLDTVFDGVELPDNVELREQTRRAKLSQAHIGKTKSPQTLQKMTEAAQRKAQDPNWQEANRKAHQFTDEKKQQIGEKISKSRIGLKLPGNGLKVWEARRKNGNTTSWNKGISPGKHTRKKLRDANLGKTIDTETRQKISNSSPHRKRIRTPWGEFDSRTLAAQYGFDNGHIPCKNVKSAGTWLSDKIKRWPDRFWYIED